MSVRSRQIEERTKRLEMNEHLKKGLREFASFLYDCIDVVAAARAEGLDRISDEELAKRFHALHERRAASRINNGA